MTDEQVTTAPGGEVEYQTVTSDSQFGAAADPERKLVKLPSWSTSAGKKAVQLWVYELTQDEWDEYQETLRVYKDGEWVGVDPKHDNLKFLAFCVRDPKSGQRIWPEVAAAIARLRPQSRTKVIVPLMAAANEVNSVGPKAVERAEGNSDETPTPSSSTT